MMDKRKFIEITAIKQKQGILQCITFLESLPFLFLKCQKVGKSAEKSWSKVRGKGRIISHWSFRDLLEKQRQPELVRTRLRLFLGLRF